MQIALIGFVYSAALLLFSLLYFRKAARREHAKTHSLILTTLIFDETGRILVTPAGTLPGTAGVVGAVASFKQQYFGGV